MTRHNASEKIGVYHTASPPKIAARRRSTALCSASPRPTEIQIAGHGALDGGHKPTDDDVEAQQQIRNAVAPECTDGVGDELIARVRKVRAHDLRREEKDEQKQRRREDADGRERVAQKFLTARVILFAVVIAHKRLRALRDADHEVNEQWSSRRR